MDNYTETFKYQTSLTVYLKSIKTLNEWVITVSEMESWLNEHIGEQDHKWTYVNYGINITIGFTEPEHKTFFLIGYPK